MEFTNRISGFDMGLGDQSGDAFRFGEPLPFTAPHTAPAPQAAPPRVTVADIYQAAIKQAIHDYELNRLFNPDHYDYQI